MVCWRAGANRMQYYFHIMQNVLATSMLMTIMNVSKFAENLVKKHISFLLRRIPLTTKFWFKIHHLLKSRTSLNKTVQSSDVQTFLYSRNTLLSFTTICQFHFFQVNSPQRTLGTFSHREQLEMKEQRRRLLPSPLKGEDPLWTNAAGLPGIPKIVPTRLWASPVYPISFLSKFADTQPSFDWLTNWSINYVFSCLAISH